MTSFAGLRGTDDWGTDERPKNFREMILWLNPNGMAPLTALMARMRKETVDDPEFAWWEEKLDLVRVAETTGLSNNVGSNTITASGGGLLALVPGDVLLVEKTEIAAYDNELLEVSSITSDTVIVVKRGAAGSDVDGIGTGTFLTKIGNAFEEGSGAPDIAQRNPTKLLNYTQIFKTAVGQTRTATQTRARTGDAWSNDKKRKMFDHSTAMELAWLFGQAAEEVAGTHPRRYTGGLREFITTNVKIYTTSPTEDDFLDFIHKVFDFESGGAGDERLVLCGNGFLNELNKLGRNSSSTRINFDGTFKTYGMNLQRWVTPQGTFGLKTHPLMNIHGRFNNSAFIIDPTSIIYRPLQGRDTKFQDNIQNNDSDTRKAQWITEAGIEVEHEETMAYIGNFVI